MAPSPRTNSFSDIDRLAINTIRTLSIDMVQNANSGHPGLPLGASPMAYVLWQNHLKFDPENPDWPDRDRFVLSAGHGSALIYSLIHLAGYDLSLADLRAFRQWESRTPGHPEVHLTDGVEATTGPLGQGTSNSIGMAIAERALADLFNRPGFPIVDHWTYALVSDGDLMEGVAAEACSYAGFLNLGKLVFLFDSNQITLDGPLSQSADEDVAKRFEAYGWQVLHVADGDTDLEAIDRAITAARSDTERPSLIIVETTIGYGSPNRSGTHRAHGEPLGEDEVVLTKQTLDWAWPDQSFHVPDQVLEHMDASKRGGPAAREWQELFERYASEHPNLADKWSLAQSGDLPPGWDSDLPTWEPGESLATRVASGKALNAIAPHVPWLIGGDADLAGSTKTTIADTGSFDGQTGAGRNFHFGIREHGMAGIANGMVYHGGIRPYASTFFVFSDYMRPSVRLAALNDLPVIYVWTHDSIGVGEDGPTHQPVEHLMSLRAMPNLAVVRPADANETVAAWKWAMEHGNGPVALVLSRQGLPVIDRDGRGAAEELERGAYVLADPRDGDPEAIIIATGSEVSTAMKAQELLSAEGVQARVVSMPIWEAFAAQDAQYRASVLPPEIKTRVSVEAGVTLGWERWIGDAGRAIGVDRFGASAPGPINMEEYGITAERVARTVRELVGQPAAH